MGPRALLSWVANIREYTLLAEQFHSGLPRPGKCNIKETLRHKGFSEEATTVNGVMPMPAVY